MAKKTREDATRMGDENKSSKLLELVLKIQECESWDELSEVCVVGLKSFFGLVDVKWVDYSIAWRKVIWTNSTFPMEERSLRTFMIKIFRDGSRLGDFYDAVYKYTLCQVDESYAVRDFYSDEELEELVIYKKVMEPMGVKDFVYIQCHFAEKVGTVILLLCFPDECDGESRKKELEYIRDHLRIACGRLSRIATMTNLAQILKEVHQPGSTSGISMVTSKGVITEMDSISRNIMSELGGYVGENRKFQLPNRVLDWLTIKRGEALRITAQSDPVSELFKTWKGDEVRVKLLSDSAGRGSILITSIKEQFKTENLKLTRSELGVVRALCAGLTNSQIAKGLSISKRTVDKHLENVFCKMGVNDRGAAMAYFENLYQ